MNGCLFKTLLIIIVLIGLFFGYPYFKKYTSDSMQEKISNLENKGTIVGKIIKYLPLPDHKASEVKPQEVKPAEVRQEIIKEIKPNDNTKNKEAGK